MHGIYIGNNKMLIKTLMNLRMFSYADDKSLTPELVLNGVFEVPLTKFIANNIKPGNTVIDVGANIGYFTLLMGLIVGPSGKVISYEASKKNFELLKENVSYHGLGKASDIRRKAIYKEETELTFYSSHSWYGNSSLLKPDERYFSLFKSDHIVEEKVQAEPLDIHVNENFIDFIKIDIEGGEYNALIGMEQLLKSKKVGKVIFEINNLRSEGNQFYDLLKNYQIKYNLRFFDINSNGDPVYTPLEDLFKRDFVESVLMDCSGLANV